MENSPAFWDKSVCVVIPDLRHTLSISCVAFLLFSNPQRTLHTSSHPHWHLEWRIILHPGVDFINILRASFSMNVFCTAFFYFRLGFVIFWRKSIGTKAAK